MTATINQLGQIVLRTGAGEDPLVKSGDVLLVIHDRGGRIVLQKRRQARGKKSYLTPQPLSAATRARLYTRSQQDWESVEEEAVTLGRQALAGKRLENL